MKKQKSKVAGLQKRKAISGYLFIAPFIIGFLFFMMKPMVQSMFMSFSDVEVGAGLIKNHYIGLKNFYDAFRIDPDYTRFLTEELLRMIKYSLGIMVFSLFVSLLLNQEFAGRGLVRAIFFLPVILSSGVILGIEQNNSLMAQIADMVDLAAEGVSMTAVLQDVLRTAGIGVKAFEVVFEIIDNIKEVASASGIQIIIFLSGLQSISKSMYEAADIEGCTKWESFWKITFPMISSLFLVNWIYTIVDFALRSDNQVMDKVDTKLVTELAYGPASAMAWTYFGIIALFIAITSALISKGVYYSD